MDLNHQLAKIGLYSLAKESNRTELPYLLVGGLAVQVYSHDQFKEYHRPTLDADISVPRMDFKVFKKTHGSMIGHNLKNLFGLGYHIIDSQFANTVQLMVSQTYSQKEVFLLHFNRYQIELYSRIEEKILEDISNNYENISLNDIGITNENIKRKANIKDCNNLYLHVLNEAEVLKHKVGKIVSKSNSLSTLIDSDFKTIRDGVVSKGLSYSSDLNISSLHEQVSRSYLSDLEKYHIEKDLYDFVLLKKVFS